MFDAVAGVEPQSETVWRQADQYDVPRMCFVNKMDRMGANFYRCVDMIVDRLGATPLVMQLPIGAEAEFAGVVDLLNDRAIVWKNEDLGAEFEYVDIPADLAEKAAEYREQMIETALEQDDALMEAYFEGETPSTEQLIACIRKGTIAGDFVPVLCGTAFKNKGVQPMLDAVVDYLPSPVDLPPVKGVIPRDESEGERAPSDDEPFSGLAFKIMTDPHMGTLTFVRIYSGTVSKGANVINSTKDGKERVGRMVQMHARKTEDLQVARTGDIVAIASLKNTTTGDTLCDTGKPIILERMEFPDPVIEVAVEPKTKADQEKMGLALQRLAAEDPSFRVNSDEESGQTVISGMGELHLDILVDRMKREFKVEANVGAPQVAYRETITKPFRCDYTHKKQSGGAGQFARIILEISPNEKGAGFEFESGIVGGSIPREYIPAVEKGLGDASSNGVLAGFPLIDWKARLVDGASHDVDSSAIAFEIAARAAFREGIPQAGPALLEPVMKVEVVTPEEYMGDVIGDLNSRRGQVQGTEARGNATVVTSMVPLANMFGYINNLRSMSSGRAQFSMQFDHYDQVPKAVADEVVSKMA